MTRRHSLRRVPAAGPCGAPLPGLPGAGPPRCQAGHACPPKRARVAALAAEMAARLVRYRVVLTLEVDSASGSPDSWDWPSRLGLRPPEASSPRCGG